MTGDHSNDTSGQHSIELGLIMGSLALALVAVLMVGVAPAAAGNSADTQLADKSVTVDNETQEVYLEVTNTSGQLVNYTVYGVDDGLTTQVNSGQISAAANNTTQKTFAANGTAYDSYRFTVSEDPSDNDNETVESVSVGKIVEQSADSDGGAIFGGGGGGLLTPMNVVIAILVMAVAYLIGLFDPLKERISG
jgi:hypothetical protein